MSIQDAIVKEYGNRLRLRVCGFLVEGETVLLLNHANLGKSDFWIPPGGGMEFGESASETLQREFAEETGLTIRIKRFLCVHEYQALPLHGIELFFEVEKTGGDLRLGFDPEMNVSHQILKQLEFIPIPELKNFAPDVLHPVLQHLRRSGKLDSLNGYSLNGDKFH
jgi:8-oxo-dGTP diphosphatase